MRKTSAIFLLLFICSLAKAQSTTDSLTDTTALEAVSSDSLKVFEKVDIEAEFPGGLDAWRQFLEKNLNPLVPADRGAPDGSYAVVVRFIVDVDGSVSNFKAMTNYGYGMEKEVFRVLKNSPKWSPAVKNGHNVKAYRSQPITFVVETVKKKKRKRDE